MIGLRYQMKGGKIYLWPFRRPTRPQAHEKKVLLHERTGDTQCAFAKEN